MRAEAVCLNSAQKYGGQIILSLACGIDVRLQGDPFVEAAENMLRAMAFTATKESSLFDTITWRMSCCAFSESSKMFLTDASYSDRNPFAGLVSRSTPETCCA
jgi:hypothetical protein